jgi:hypothetical protein
MSRLLVVLCLSIGMTTVAHADNSNTAYNNGYAGGGPLLATIAAGALISFVQGQRPVVASPNNFYEGVNQPLITMPFSGTRCELNSQMVNGQLVQGQICR